MKKCTKLTSKQKQELQAIINNPKSSGREIQRTQVALLFNQETALEAIIYRVNQLQ